jgi:phosphate transport system protein
MGEDVVRHFDEELLALKEQIVLMGARSEDLVRRSIVALYRCDAVMAEQVISDDRAIDEMELDIEQRCIDLLALRQPMAVDLRFLTAALKISNDLERVGDHGVNIAGNVIRLASHTAAQLPDQFQLLAEVSTGLLRDTLDAFARKDAKTARTLVRRDDKVDELNRQVFKQLVSMMNQDSGAISTCMDLIMVSRNLERVGDLATNIAEEVVFINDAQVIRHKGAQSQEEGADGAAL